MTENAVGLVQSALDAIISRSPHESPQEDELVPLAEALCAATRAGRQDEALDLIDKVKEQIPPGSPRHSLLTMGWMTHNDAEFRAASHPHLTVRRVTRFTPEPVDVPDLGLRLEPTADDSFAVRTTDPAERLAITIAGSFQLFVLNDLPDDEAERLHSRGFDVQLLGGGALELQYSMRTMRRALWGTGLVGISQKRVVGVIFDDDVQGAKSSPERLSMPLAIIAGDGMSVVVFSIDRAAIEDHVVSQGFGQSRFPTVHLNGEVSLAMDTYRVLGPDDRLVKPGKHEIRDAVRGFVPAM